MLTIECVAALDGVPVEPCGTVGGQPLAPVVRQVEPLPALDFTGIGELFSWSLSLVLVTFLVGIAIGSMIQIIRSG